MGRRSFLAMVLGYFSGLWWTKKPNLVYREFLVIIDRDQVPDGDYMKLAMEQIDRSEFNLPKYIRRVVSIERIPSAVSLYPDFNRNLTMYSFRALVELA